MDTNNSCEEKGQKDFGVLYLAFGEPYLAMALLSASTLRETNSSVPFCIISNINFDTEKIDFWDPKKDILIYLEKNSSLNRTIKVSLDKYTPFKKTIFLDSDTLVLNDISRAKLYLDFFDIAIKLNNNFKTLKGKGDVSILNDRIKVSDVPHWNSGVIMFNKNKNTGLFFQKWSELYHKHSVSYDQVSLAETVFTSNIKFLSLSSECNLHPLLLSTEKRLKEKGVIVIHYSSKISDTIVKKIYYYNNIFKGSEFKIKQFINEKDKHRKNKSGTIKYLLLRLKWKIGFKI